MLALIYKILPPPLAGLARHSYVIGPAEATSVGAELVIEPPVYFELTAASYRVTDVETGQLVRTGDARIDGLRMYFDTSGLALDPDGLPSGVYDVGFDTVPGAILTDTPPIRLLVTRG